MCLCDCVRFSMFPKCRDSSHISNIAASTLLSRQNTDINVATHTKWAYPYSQTKNHCTISKIAPRVLLLSYFIRKENIKKVINDNDTYKIIIRTKLMKEGNPPYNIYLKGSFHIHIHLLSFFILSSYTISTLPTLF